MGELLTDLRPSSARLGDSSAGTKGKGERDGDDFLCQICPGTRALPVCNGAFHRAAFVHTGRSVLDSVEVFYKDHFVLSLVVKQFVDLGLRDHDPAASGAQTPFLPSAHVIQWRASGMAPRGTCQTLKAKAATGVRDPVQQHPAGAQVRNTHLSIRIQLTTPLNCVQ